MNSKFFKKVVKLIIAGGVAGLGMLAGDRIADDKSALGDFGFGKKKADNDDFDNIDDAEIKEMTEEKVDEDDITIEEETTD